MALPTPELLRLRRRELTVLRRVLQAAWPQEGCALLLGLWGPAAGDGGAGGETAAESPPWLEVVHIWPCLNVWQPAGERQRRFALDPREQLLAQRWGRERGLRVLGSAHSHPCSEPVPSRTDRELAVAPTLQLILSPLQHWRPACWWLEAPATGPLQVLPMAWRMEH